MPMMKWKESISARYANIFPCFFLVSCHLILKCLLLSRSIHLSGTLHHSSIHPSILHKKSFPRIPICNHLLPNPPEQTDTPIEMITRMWDSCCTAFLDGSFQVVVWHSFSEQSNIKRDGGTSATYFFFSPPETPFNRYYSNCDLTQLTCGQNRSPFELQ